MTKRTLFFLAAGVATLAACEGFKEAMTAHVDVAARAGTQELSVDRLATLLSQAKVPPNAKIARAITDIWVNYQLLGQAAAKGDSLNQPKLVDSALAPLLENARIGKLLDQVAKSAVPGSAGSEQSYLQGGMLAARHILFMVPANATPAQRDSIKRKADQVRAQVTSANFADLAKKNSQDPGSAARGGDLGVFPKGVMVPEFQTALLALKPGEISPVIQTQFGYHIIRRSTYPEVKEEFARVDSSEAAQHADSQFVAKLEANGNVKVKPDAPQAMKAAGKDLVAHRNDNTVLATSSAGTLTVARVVQLVLASQQPAEIEDRLPTAPDSQVTKFIQSIARNDLLLHYADSTKVALAPDELTEFHGKVGQAVAQAWDELGVSPSKLADSAKTEAERQRVAAADVDSYLDRIMAQQARFVQVPPPIETLLHSKYEVKVNQAGIDRALERAAKLKAAEDSARAKNRPSSEVPMGPQPPAPPPAPPAKP